ncbi:hypothetical protein Trydic_g3768 [Trypoxylus dichotomus]
MSLNRGYGQSSRSHPEICAFAHGRPRLDAPEKTLANASAQPTSDAKVRSTTIYRSYMHSKRSVHSTSVRNKAGLTLSEIEVITARGSNRRRTVLKAVPTTMKGVPLPGEI